MRDEAAKDVWQRYLYAKSRGHDQYTRQARRCEKFYFGAGGQWSDEDKRYLDSQGRPAYELNEVKPSVDTAIAYQLNNRMEITYKPSGGKADNTLATIHSKLVKHIALQNDLHYVESQVYSDGLIMQRGYYEVYMDYSDSVNGDIRLRALDPFDVIPDPDAKSYDPKDWSYVLITRWLTLDEIEQLYGTDLRMRVEEEEQAEDDFGNSDFSEQRMTFSGSDGFVYNQHDSVYMDNTGVRRFRVVDCQKHVYEKSECLVFNNNDVKVIAGMSKEKIQEMEAMGGMRTMRMMKKVHWTVATRNVVLYDDVSPFPTFTIIMYSPNFRRGRTQGLIDNAIDPQEMYNKAVSQYMHIVNTTANSGWVVEENSLINMDIDELETRGSETGLVVEYKQGATPPQKIQPNQVPSGVDKLIEIAKRGLRDVTIPESARGIQSNEVSGVAIQSKQFAAQQQMAIALDNLAYTRRLLARKILELVQRFYTGPRIVRITEMDPKSGKDNDQMLEVNQEMDDGSVVNDLTIGDYDIVIAEQPMKHTFDNSQFDQIIQMRQFQVGVPDEYVILSSNLSNKYDIVEALKKLKESQGPDPLQQAQIETMQMQTQKTKAEIEKIRAATFELNTKGLYAGIQTGMAIAQDATISSIADEVVKSAGFKDQNADPVFQGNGLAGTQPINGPAPAMQQPVNTDPMSPANVPSPTTGFNKGIETMRPN